MLARVSEGCPRSPVWPSFLLLGSGGSQGRITTPCGGEHVRRQGETPSAQVILRALERRASVDCAFLLPPPGNKNDHSKFAGWYQ